MNSRSLRSRICKWGVILAYILDLRVGLYGRSRYLRQKRKDSKSLRRLDHIALLAAVPVACFVVWLVLFRERFPVPDALTRHYVTEHLEIHTDLSQSDVEFHAAFFEQFIEHFQEEYFRFQQEADWKSWVSSRPYDEDVTLVQAAFVMNESEWDVWWRENSDRLYWDEGERIYRVRNPQLIDIE